ncbi:MAG: apolipoprotein N-acyltransferase, partial [Gammaproteobacteria bacterium]|nr:apolipoprotein N-acyltransferase [Gammaproteobacteria bacterium]
MFSDLKNISKDRFRQQPILEFVSIVIAGLCLPVAFAPFGWWWLAPLCLFALFWVWQGKTPKQAFWLGFAFGFASFLTGTYWMHISLHGYGGLSWVVTLPLMLGLMAIMALYPALTGYICNRWASQANAWRWLLILPAIWTGFEWLRGWFLSGFPWLSLGISQVDSPLSGFSPIIGQYGLTFLV